MTTTLTAPSSVASGVADRCGQGTEGPALGYNAIGRTNPLKQWSTQRALNSKVTALHRRSNPGSRWSRCSQPLASRIAIERNQYGRVFASGVETCGSSAACLRCGQKVRHRRAEEVQTAVSKHLASGGTAIFATFTIPHTVQDDLNELWPIITKSWRGLTSGGAYTAFKSKYRLIGFIKCVEVTFAPSGASHPHIHAVLLFDKKIEAYSDEWLELSKWLHYRWQDQAAKRGRKVSLQHGIDVRPCRDSQGLGDYLSKVSAELCLTSSKHGKQGSRTPWQVIADFLRTGDKQDLAIFLSWCDSSKNKVLLNWSPKLKARFGIGETSDAEITAEKETGKVEGFLSKNVYFQLKRYGLDAQFQDYWEQDGHLVASSFVKAHLPDLEHHFDKDGYINLSLPNDLAVTFAAKNKQRKKQ